MAWYDYGMAYTSIYIARLSQNVSRALCTLVAEKQPSFRALFEGAKVLLCVEVVGQRLPNHRAMHSECSAANSGWLAVCEPHLSLNRVQVQAMLIISKNRHNVL